jgi:hypothetical protein
METPQGNILGNVRISPVSNLTAADVRPVRIRVKLRNHQERESDAGCVSLQSKNDFDVNRRRLQYASNRVLRRRWALERFCIGKAQRGLRFFGLSTRGPAELLALLLFWICLAGIVVSPSLSDAVKDAFANEWDGSRFFDVLLKKFDYVNLLLMIAVGAAQIYALFYKRGGTQRRQRKLKADVSNRVKTAASNVLGDLARSADFKGLTRDQCEHLARSILEIIVNELRLIYKKFEIGDFEASLLVFRGGEKGKPKWVEVAARASQHRDTDVEVPATDTIAYFVARTGRVFAEPNIRDGRHPFPVRSLSGSDPSYSSILFVPILRQETGPKRQVSAMLTIDCKAPHFFAIRDINGIAIKVRPYCRLIAMLVDSRDDLNYVRVSGGENDRS